MWTWYGGSGISPIANMVIWFCSRGLNMGIEEKCLIQVYSHNSLLFGVP
jgi:hypothetical protein